MSSQRRWLLAWFAWLTALQVGRAELYTALVDMEELLETEAVLIDTLHGFISAQEQRLATLRRYVLCVFVYLVCIVDIYIYICENGRAELLLFVCVRVYTRMWRCIVGMRACSCRKSILLFRILPACVNEELFYIYTVFCQARIY